MADFGSSYELPSNIERFLAALSKLYAQDNERLLQQLVVNAQVRVLEATDQGFDSMGHTLYLVVRDSLYVAAMKQQREVEERLQRDLNQVHNVRHEHVERVCIEMEISDVGNWREESGLLLSPARDVPPDATKRIWGEGGLLRAFLSHKSEARAEVAGLKERLSVYGVAAFVAHRDIRPTQAWQDEIMNGLASMDAFVALMTADFHDSEYTDQEVGFALARGVPVIAVQLGRVPYGFLGKFQALSADWNTSAEGIVKLLINHDRMFSAYVQAMRNCTSFDNGNLLSQILPSIEKLNPQQIDDLISAYNANSEVRGSFGFNGTKPRYWGDGLIAHLHRLGTRQFTMSSDSGRLITPVSAARPSRQRAEILF